MPISFTKVSLPNGYLGNMSPHPISYGGVSYPTAEHLFQSLRFTNQDIIKEIISVKSPMAAKMIAKKNSNQMVVTPRSSLDIKNMLQVLFLKFSQHPDLNEKLLATEEEELIENCTSRANESGLFWGAAKDGDAWKGRNILGKLLNIVRSSHKNNESRS